MSNSILPEFDTAPRLVKKPGPLSAGPKLSKASASDPCVGCPRETCNFKIGPTFADDPTLGAVGMAPGDDEEFQGKVFVGPTGTMLRDALTQAGIDPERCFYGNLGRCRPENDDFDTPAWKKAEGRCWKFLEVDLQSVPPDRPLLLLGKRPLQAFSANNKLKIGAYRGLWIQAKGRNCFVARHPAQTLREKDPATRSALIAEFYSDIRRMADRMFGREADQGIKMYVYDSPLAARPLIKRLAATTAPWAFDIESYDAGKFPSRHDVAVDACHPDFRLRGIAIAWGADRGGYIDCKGWEGNDEARQLLSTAFASESDKWAFFGEIDENALAYPRNGWSWVSEVRHRRGDGGLALIALGDGTHDSLRLEKAVVEILGKPQYWNGLDKSTMRDQPLQIVAENAIGDACRTFELCSLLHGRLQRAEYMTWRK